MTTELAKNIIFVTGNVNGDYKELAQELSLSLSKSLYIAQPFPSFRNFMSTREAAIEKSLFFSQVLFYGSLPSRSNVIISIPDLNMRTILQFLILFESVRKNVFVVIDDRLFVTAYSRQKYLELKGKLPPESCVFASEFARDIKTPPVVFIGRILDKLAYNSKTINNATLKNFNGILAGVPDIFKDEIRKSVFGSDFGDIPFNRLAKNLLPEFDDAEEEEINEDLENFKIDSQKTIPDYFKPMETEKREEEEEETFSPINDEFISLLEVFPDDTTTSSIQTTTTETK